MMLTRKMSMFALSILAGLAHSSVVGAAPPQPQQERLEHIARATQLLGERKWAAARAEYEAALALAPEVFTMTSIAGCLEQEGRLVLAQERYREALASNEALPKPDASLSSEIRQKLAELKARTPKLVLVELSPPDGLVLELDGDVGAIKNGQREIDVDPGSHVLTAAARGYTPRRYSITLQERERASLEVRLEPLAREPPPVALKPTRVVGPQTLLTTAPQKVDRTWSTVAFSGAGALGVAGVAVGVHTYFRAVQAVGDCNKGTTPFGSCWNDLRGSIQGEGTAMAIVFAMSGTGRLWGTHRVLERQRGARSVGARRRRANRILDRSVRGHPHR